MSDADKQRRADTGQEPDGTRPAVGLVATADNADAVAGAVLRAHRNGYQAVVVSAAGQEVEALSFARDLGAVVETRTDPPSRDPRERLAATARQAGFPGLLVPDEAAIRIDFEASERALTDATDYAIEAVSSPSADPDARVLAAIPAYNESGTVGTVVREARRYADEVLVVDDASDDDTAERAREAGATVVVHDRNRGYGAALRTAFEEADRAAVGRLVVLDADGQHDPADIPRLVEHHRETGADIVIGSRFAEGGETDIPAYRWVGLQTVNLLTNLSLGVVRPRSWVADTQSGFRVYGRRVIESLAEEADIGDHMGASTDILHHAHRNDYRIEEVGTTVDYDVENASEHNPVAHGLQLVNNLLRTIERERPVTVLGIPGFLSTLVGIGFAYWTFVVYINTTTFPLGLALASSFFALAGILACFTGIILHAMNTHLE